LWKPVNLQSVNIDNITVKQTFVRAPQDFYTVQVSLQGLGIHLNVFFVSAGLLEILL
jgi:hypothetical protein